MFDFGPRRDAERSLHLSQDAGDSGSLLLNSKGDPGGLTAMNPLFPILQESHDLIFIYSPGIRDFE